MKKLLSIILALLILSCTILFSGCVSNIEDVAGIYKFAELYTEEKTYKVDYAFNETVLTEDSAILTLNNDETFSATYTDLDYGTVNGVWDKMENIIIFNSVGFQTVLLKFEIKSNSDLQLLVDKNAVILLTKKDWFNQSFLIKRH